MAKFIYVFEKRAVKDLKKRGYELLKEDEQNEVWIFANKDSDDRELDFAVNYQVVLSNVISL